MKKTTLMVAATLLASAVFAADAGANTAKKTMSLGEARSMISQVFEEPAKMTEIMKSLSEADQATFLADVNAAIATSGGDTADRTAMFVEVNNAALAGAQKGNALTLVAEVYATVPPYALAAVSESLASGLMNRASEGNTAGNTTYDNTQFANISKMVMKKVNDRVGNDENAGVRSAMAGLMLINASNGTDAEIVNAVVESLPDDVRDDAKTSWYPAALGVNGGEKDYSGIMDEVKGDDNAGGDSPNGNLVSIRVSGAQNYEGMLADIVASSTDPKAAASEYTPMIDAIQNPLTYNLPGAAGDDSGDTGTIVNDVEKFIEGDGYSGQYTK